MTELHSVGTGVLHALQHGSMTGLAAVMLFALVGGYLVMVVEDRMEWFSDD